VYIFIYQNKVACASNHKFTPPLFHGQYSRKKLDKPMANHSGFWMTEVTVA